MSANVLYARMERGIVPDFNRFDDSASVVAGAPGNTQYPGIWKVFLAWNVIGVLTAARYILPFGRFSPGPFSGMLPLLLSCVLFYYPWAMLTPLVFRLERRLPLGSPGWPGRLAVLAAISVPFCLVASPLMVALWSAPGFVFGAAPRGARLGFWFIHFPTAEINFWCSVAGGYFFRTLFQLHEHEKRAARLALEKSQLESSLNQAQLDALRARLNPHFLFNSLQNISVLTKQDPQTASRMLTVLGDLLRAVLRRDSQPESTLREEIDLTQSYVALEQMRFADRLHVTFDIAEEAYQTMVPCFLMQPLIENAITHGLKGFRKTGIITVRTALENGQLVISVADNGIGPPADSNGMKVGIGLGSTCERLTRMYGEKHSFSMRRQPEGGTEVRIALPLRVTGQVDLSEHLPRTNR
jgi:two-component system, LytTR family, sensor kinase